MVTGGASKYVVAGNVGGAAPATECSVSKGSVDPAASGPSKVSQQYLMAR